MRTTTCLVLMLSCGLLAPGAVSAQIPADLLQKMRGYEFGQSRATLLAVEGMVRESLADAAKKKAVAAQLATLLGEDVSLSCKDFACRQLVIVGGVEQVPAVAALLNDLKTADMARYALEALPGPDADKALAAALKTTSGSTKIGIINSLGNRRAAAETASLTDIARTGAAAEALAALAALGRIGASSLDALRELEAGANEALKRAAADALLLAAEDAARAGNLSGARTAYAQLSAPGEPEKIRAAATRALAALAAPKASAGK